VLPDGVTTGTEAYDYQCDEVVVAPVLNAHKMGTMGSTPGGIPPVVNGSFGPGVVLVAGFELMYNTHSQQCDGCESSGGWCGYRHNHTNGAMGFVCFCDSGPTPERCGAYVSSSPHLIAFDILRDCILRTAWNILFDEVRHTVCSFALCCASNQEHLDFFFDGEHF
jgi:hypothetical protein